MTRTIIFDGKFCRVLKIVTAAQTTFLVEAPDGADGMGHIRWAAAQDKRNVDDILQELAIAIDREQERANALVKVPTKKK
jgi:hypothetical protein